VDSTWIFIVPNSQSRQNKNISWMVSVFLYLKQVVFRSTYSFYGILTKITIPVSSWWESKSYENPATVRL
jgi:hypothetical protein